MKDNQWKNHLLLKMDYSSPAIIKKVSKMFVLCTCVISEIFDCHLDIGYFTMFSGSKVAQIKKVMIFKEQKAAKPGK